MRVGQALQDFSGFYSEYLCALDETLKFQCVYSVCVCVCVCGPRLITLLYWLLIEILQQEKNCTEPLLVGYVSLVKEKNMRADLFRKKFYKLLSNSFFAIYHQ